MSRQKGRAFESKVKAYLKQQGLKWITQNYSSPFGEIDLIFSDGDCLVFVEVRMRHSDSFGGALESVTLGKQAKLIKTAEHYLVEKGKYDKIACRFDVVCVDGQGDIEWISNAFST